MDFESRLNVGVRFENQFYDDLHELSKFSHVTDKIFWTSWCEPILIEYKASRNIEWESWVEYSDVSDLGYKIVFVYEDRLNTRQNSKGKKANWFRKIDCDGEKKGCGGSFNNFTTIRGGMRYDEFHAKFIEWNNDLHITHTPKEQP